jgi:transposase-like protein
MGRPPKYTPEQKMAALDLYAEHGPSEAARRCGISKNTIVSWARRGGMQPGAAPERMGTPCVEVKIVISLCCHAST